MKANGLLSACEDILLPIQVASLVLETNGESWVFYPLWDCLH